MTAIRTATRAPEPADDPVDVPVPTGTARPAPRRPPITALRWGAMAVGLALAATGGYPTWAVVPGALALIAYAAYRTARPIPYRDDVRTTVAVVLEVGVHVVAVEATGYWASPFVYSLVAAIVVASFARGFAFALRISLVSIVAVALPYHLTTGDELGLALGRTRDAAIQLVLVAVIAGYARRVMGEAEERHSVTLDRLGRLAEANSLLYSLHRVAQVLPASLDLDEALDSTVERLRTFFDVSALGVFLADETSNGWLVARQEGVRLPGYLDVEQLPASVRAATAHDSTVVERQLSTRGGGLTAASGSGLYAPLRARGQLVGVLAVERVEPDGFPAGDVSLLDGFTEAAALAIDNARWFARLRTVGADEERMRIARELHDRVGQSLAYLAFEMDRLRACDDAELRTGVDGLRADVRTVLGEIRETLYDLRTDVSETAGFGDTVQPFLDRVGKRSGLVAVLEDRATGRLPLPQEREVWRIAQEAVTNAERHSGGGTVVVRWACDGARAELEVVDDGVGFETRKAGRMDSYGILGMRERAAGIGATLSVESTPGRGTSVRCAVTP